VDGPAFIDSSDGVVGVKAISRQQPHSFLFTGDPPWNAVEAVHLATSPMVVAKVAESGGLRTVAVPLHQGSVVRLISSGGITRNSNWVYWYGDGTSIYIRLPSTQETDTGGRKYVVPAFVISLRHRACVAWEPESNGASVKVVFSLSERTNNIWMAEWKAQ
jgi:hypothetical protein